MYDIYIYKLSFKQLDKRRKKKIFTLVAKIDNIPLEYLSRKMLEAKKIYNDFKYKIDFVERGKDYNDKSIYKH